MCTLTKPYLTGRYQQVVLNSKISNHNIYSKWSINSKGVPQGSIFGPLFFLISISDILITLHNNSIAILLAADTNILITTSKMKDLLKKQVRPSNYYFNSVTVT
jgi:hypothetical protein